MCVTSGLAWHQHGDSEDGVMRLGPRDREKREGEKVTEGDGNDGNGVFTWSHSIVSEEGGGGQTAMIGTMLG